MYTRLKGEPTALAATPIFPAPPPHLTGSPQPDSCKFHAMLKLLTVTSRRFILKMTIRLSLQRDFSDEFEQAEILSF
eukprot:COSAG02_NODE_1508_length_12230_cov_7.647597_4_plen_77_part_00